LGEQSALCVRVGRLAAASNAPSIRGSLQTACWDAAGSKARSCRTVRIRSKRHAGDRNRLRGITEPRTEHTHSRCPPPPSTAQGREGGAPRAHSWAVAPAWRPRRPASPTVADARRLQRHRATAQDEWSWGATSWRRGSRGVGGELLSAHGEDTRSGADRLARKSSEPSGVFRVNWDPPLDRFNAPRDLTPAPLRESSVARTHPGRRLRLAATVKRCSDQLETSARAWTRIASRGRVWGEVGTEAASYRL